MRIDRRRFLKAASLAAGSGLLPLLATASSGTLARRGPAKKVLIVGAGLAGLSAGWELTRAGHDVTILEAQLRPGGRVLTLREPFSDGLYSEAGATDIPNTHDLTLRYTHEFDLPLASDAVLPSGLGTVYFLKGKRFAVAADTEPHYPYDLTQEERKLGWGGMWRTYIRPAVDEMGDPAASDWTVPAKYDGMTYSEFLRSRGASAGAVELLGTAVQRWGDGPETISAAVALRDAVSEVHATRWFRIRGGSDLLPRAFADRLRDRIRYGSPVTRIEQESKGVRAITAQAGGQRTFAADYLVCAIPFSVLRRIEVSPDFSPAKRRAINELPYFSATRIALQSRTRFWLKDRLDGEAWTDLPIMQLQHMTSSQPGPRGILQNYCGGPDARRIMAMPQQERVAFVLGQVETLYPGIRDSFEGGVSKCWDEDLWARGASSWYRPGQMQELWPHIAHPEGRIHFAGDHTSPWIRWMQGALHSGNRVAREINDARH